MQYLGSKNQIAKKILPLMLKEREYDAVWVEPFVGGANMIDKVEGPRIGNDINTPLIKLWEALQRGWVPPDTITREQYVQINHNKAAYPPELVCFVGFLCSFGGKWFGGYAFNNKGDNYAARGSRALLKQKPLIQDVLFLNHDYRELPLPGKCLIYCDPPYKNTTAYKDSFSHKEFWNWVRATSDKHPVFVSEYEAPDDFECLIEIPVKTKLDRNSNYPRLEKLFKFKK